MDLLQTVRKEGSRGGRSEFKWEDVKNDAQRENYLGHSLMAPVGRWQKGRDLNWYARGNEDDTQSAAEKLAEEKRRIKEAEEDAMLAAMGLPVPERAANNANLTPLGEKASEADVKRAMAEIAADDDGDEHGKGIGYGEYSGGASVPSGDGDVLEGREWSGPPRREKSRERKERRDKRDKDDSRKRRRRSRSRSREHRHRRRSRSRTPERRGEKERDRDQDRRRHRSRSHERRGDERRRHRRDRGSDDERLRDRSKDRNRRRRSRSPYDRGDRRDRRNRRRD